MLHDNRNRKLNIDMSSLNQEVNIKIGSKVREISSLNCGKANPVRIIANIGTTLDTDTIEGELTKANAAIQAGADIITDHSVGGDIKKIHQSLIDIIPSTLSTVSVYQAYVEAKKERDECFREHEALLKFEEQASLGFDLITIHATVLREDLPYIAHSSRLIPATSRGGMMVCDSMMENNIENPYWTHFRDILKIAQKYGTTISLGTTFRPASILDLPDYLYKKELERMAKLVGIALNNGVGIMVEGIGHASLDVIPHIVRDAKKMCKGVPYRILSTACDTALNFDHIASAIASATAVASGADVISAVSRAEHVRQPTAEDIVEAIETARIAAHCGDIVRRRDIIFDKEISKMRGQSICNPKGASAILKLKDNRMRNDCTMCGSYCALKIMQKIKKQYI